MTGAEQPYRRKTVQNVLLKAEEVSKLENLPSTMVLYLTHDMAHEMPLATYDDGEGIRCCTSGNRNVISSSLLHSACLPISIAGDDPFFQRGNVGCLNIHRSEMSSPKGGLKFGEVRNKATPFLDHCIEVNKTKRAPFVLIEMVN